ncbi:MAG: S-layer homology domain-containing protein [Clostridiales bacterium]|jgi:hypothetical protein|nr:S-layer homology domain-containing protein [Clostridiales bacterium]
MTRFKIIQRVLPVLLATIILLPANFTTVQAKINYPDVPNTHWASRSINILAYEGVLDGYPDGTFKPDNNVTRGEMAKIITEAFGLTNNAGVTYQDFGSNAAYKNEWYAPYATSLYYYYKPHYNPTLPQNFNGYQEATRFDVAQVLVNVINDNYQNDWTTKGYDIPDNYRDILNQHFSDATYQNHADEISTYPPEYTYMAYNLGIIKGYPDNTFRPFANITRAEFCEMVVRAAPEKFTTEQITTSLNGTYELREVRVYDPYSGNEDNGRTITRENFGTDTFDINANAESGPFNIGLEGNPVIIAANNEIAKIVTDTNSTDITVSTTYSFVYDVGTMQTVTAEQEGALCFLTANGMTYAVVMRGDGGFDMYNVNSQMGLPIYHFNLV